MTYEKNVKRENYFPKWGPQILIRIVFDKMYILGFGLKKTVENKKFHYLTKIYGIQNKN